MDEIIKELTTLRKEIDKSKTRFDQLSGREEEILKRLKTEFNVDSIEDAEKLLHDLGIKLKTMEEEIRSDFDTLKLEYEW